MGLAGSGSGCEIGAISGVGTGFGVVGGNGQGLLPVQLGSTLSGLDSSSGFSGLICGLSSLCCLGDGAGFGFGRLLSEDVSVGISPFISLVRNSILTKAIDGLPPLVSTYIPSGAFSISLTRREKLSLASVSGTILSIGTFNIVPSNYFVI